MKTIGLTGLMLVLCLAGAEALISMGAGKVVCQ